MVEVLKSCIVLMNLLEIGGWIAGSSLMKNIGWDSLLWFFEMLSSAIYECNLCPSFGATSSILINFVRKKRHLFDVSMCLSVLNSATQVNLNEVNSFILWSI